MKLNPIGWLLGGQKDKKPPVLLAVTPPRTGERTLLGVENLLQSIAVPEPFSLELAGDADGVTLMARCRDDEVVKGQISAHYPQARIQEVPHEEDPLRLDEGEEAWSMTLAADGPDYLPLRTFRDDDLLDPGSDPLIALIGALSTLHDKERIVARILLRSLGPDWSAAHMNKAVRNPATEHRDASYTYQTKPLQTDGVLMIVLGLAALSVFQGYFWMQGGETWKGRTPGRWRGLGDGRGGLGLVALEEGSLPRPRPAVDQGEGLPHRLWRGAPGHRHPAQGGFREASPRAVGSRCGGLPPLRQPRRSPLPGGQSAAGDPHPLNAARFHGALRQAQRPGGAGGGIPVAPAGRKR